jgi:hypothetical protein
MNMQALRCSNDVVVTTVVRALRHSLAVRHCRRALLSGFSVQVGAWHQWHNQLALWWRVRYHSVTFWVASCTLLLLWQLV